MGISTGWIRKRQTILRRGSRIRRRKRRLVFVLVSVKGRKVKIQRRQQIPKI